MNERRELDPFGLLMVLLTLGTVSVFAAPQFTNTMYWTTDTTIMQKYVLGYVGVITNYTDALRICNEHASSSVAISIQFVGLAADGGYASYIKQFVVYNPNDQSQWVGFTYTGETRESLVQIATLAPGECVTLGVSVLVSGDLPSTAVLSSSYLAIYQVNIVMSR